MMRPRTRSVFEKENRDRLLKRAQMLVRMLEMDTPPMVVVNQAALVVMSASAYGSVHGVSPFGAIGSQIATSQRKAQGYCSHCDGDPNACLPGETICATCSARGVIENAQYLSPDIE